MAILCFSFVASAASVDGKWTAEIPGRNGTQTNTFTFKSSGATVEGTMTTMRGDQPFTITQPGRNGGDPMKIVYTGKVKGDSIDFSYDRGRGPQTFTAKKAM